ncbi:MAG: hypothetical protein OXU32_06160 [Gammaproteobacteria bacterium]|nr:hypothetical protein [Gammaproteobacteria bacterium]
MSLTEWPARRFDRDDGKPMGIRDSIADEIQCSRCGELRDRSDVDRLLWCVGCRARARLIATRRARIAATGLAVIVAGYIWGIIRPTDVVIGGWIATVIAAYWIGGKLAREIFYGIERSNRKRYPGSTG